MIITIQDLRTPPLCPRRSDGMTWTKAKRDGFQYKDQTEPEKAMQKGKIQSTGIRLNKKGFQYLVKWQKGWLTGNACDVHPIQNRTEPEEVHTMYMFWNPTIHSKKCSRHKAHSSQTHEPRQRIRSELKTLAGVCNQLPTVPGEYHAAHSHVIPQLSL